MDTASERSPVLMEHTLYIHVKEFSNLFLNIVMLCLVSLYLQKRLCDYSFCTKFIEQTDLEVELCNPSCV